MFTNEYPVHHTAAARIPIEEGGGWEFQCPECSYRVRYLDDRSSPHLEILNAGDPGARHTNNHRGTRRSPASRDEDWLTPELRQHIDEILRRADRND